ncbi:MAG TPA: MarP family serine protease [Gaiellaceae bacterium]|nr:MarP family serine protease [Gaiellaceae bacterium]
MNVVDWVALAVVALSAIAGWRRGLVLSALSLGGLVLGAWAGSQLAPHLLRGGAASRWTPLAGLVGAVIGAALLQLVATGVWSLLRRGLRLTPLRVLDSAGGIVFGAFAGLALVWVAGAAALLLPGQTQLRREVLRSELVTRLNERVPPRELLNVLARIDPFPAIIGPAAPSGPTSAAIARAPAVTRAAESVVKVTGLACGIGIEGSGWFAQPDLVVTNAHVVAGESDTTVRLPSGRVRPADVVAFDSHNDVAVLRVDGVTATPLRLSPPEPGAAVAIAGYPEDGPLTLTAGRIGRTAAVLTDDAYGNGPVTRIITAVAGSVRHGNSGGPAIDRRGRVAATMFAARLDSRSGFGIPAPVVQRALASAQARPVSTGDCAAG